MHVMPYYCFISSQTFLLLLLPLPSSTLQKKLKLCKWQQRSGKGFQWKNKTNKRINQRTNPTSKQKTTHYAQQYEKVKCLKELSTKSDIGLEAPCSSFKTFSNKDIKSNSQHTPSTKQRNAGENWREIQSNIFC